MHEHTICTWYLASSIYDVYAYLKGYDYRDFVSR